MLYYAATENVLRRARFSQPNGRMLGARTIRELHKNGIEVILDVVYNHTAEGGDRRLKARLQHCVQASIVRRMPIQASNPSRFDAFFDFSCAVAGIFSGEPLTREWHPLSAAAGWPREYLHGSGQYPAASDRRVPVMALYGGEKANAAGSATRPYPARE